MKRQNSIAVVSAVAALSTITGCSNLPGTNQQQGAVIGGASGAAVGAAVGGEHHRVLGAILGGAAGAAGGYVVGANSDKIMGKDSQGAEEAARRSQEHPATRDDVRNSATADLNKDGFVTLDEVVALREAGLSEDEMLNRLRATNQIFELTTDQQNYLRSRGVSDRVIGEMLRMNQQPGTLDTNRGEVIGRPRTSTYPSPSPYPPGNAPGL